ncbi:MAG: DUF885 domain-containing protein [Verrucomicrobia bacterium]|nr:DUF885 domain-containing protein [Verrucomicrobiota bacterium]
MTTRRSLLALLATGCLAAGILRAGNADDALYRYFHERLEVQFALRPLDATRLGDRRFDDRLDDLSPAGQARWLAVVRETLRDLPRRVDYARLSRDAQIDFEIWRHDLRKTLWLAENTRPYQDDPRLYGEYISDSVFLLLTQSTLPREQNLANALARMAQVPAVVAAARANLTRPPRSVLETAILQNRGAIAFYRGGILDFVGDGPERARFQAAGERLAAVLEDYQRFLDEELRPRATDHWRLGRARFARKLELELDTGQTAAEVLADAEAEAVRVVNDMYVIARQLWSKYQPGRPLPPADAAGRRETIRRVLRGVSQEHGRGEDLVHNARATVERVKSFIRMADILRLPEPDRCDVIEMPEFQRGNSVAYLNPAPPLEPQAPSFYAVSPPAANWSAEQVKSLLEEYNRHMLQILTIHEAYPGHYVQLEYSNRARSPIRRVLQNGTMIEGWAVYTEQMMLDQGYGDGDLALRLTQLKFYLRAVLNAILDHRMHAGRMTDDEAVRLLTEDGFQSAEEARLKIIRAKQTSVQLSTYFAGRMAMVRLRQAVQSESGERFDLGRFHEAVLDHGSVPVKYLPELVRRRLTEPR